MSITPSFQLPRKFVLSDKGVPEVIISGNGPKPEAFLQRVGFQYITSSPRYPKSNGFIERQVQTVKHTLDKARKSGQDPHMSMLCLRITPIDSQLPSPAELLYQRKLQSNFPIRVGNQVPDRDAITQRLTEHNST